MQPVLEQPASWAPGSQMTRTVSFKLPHWVSKVAPGSRAIVFPVEFSLRLHVSSRHAFLLLMLERVLAHRSPAQTALALGGQWSVSVNAVRGKASRLSSWQEIFGVNQRECDKWGFREVRVLSPSCRQQLGVLTQWLAGLWRCMLVNLKSGFRDPCLPIWPQSRTRLGLGSS